MLLIIVIYIRTIIQFLDLYLKLVATEIAYAIKVQ